MLEKKNRIPSKIMDNVIKSGKSFHADTFYGKILLNDIKNPRFAVILSAKMIKKSTDRHLLKRRIVCVIREFLKKYPQTLTKPFDLVIFPKKGVLLLNYPQILSEINKILEHVFLSL